MESNNKGSRFQSFLLTSYLDEVADRVEALRRNAQSISDEKKSLLTMLHQLKAETNAESSLSQGSSEDLKIQIESLEQRCHSVEVSLKTVRTAQQVEAFEKINQMVLDLERQCLLGNGKEFCGHAKAMLNACVSESGLGAAVDFRFQGMILECKLEDQKNIRHRLECLVDGRCHPTVIEKLGELCQGNGTSASGFS